jgi:predicted ester cyclase
MFKRLLLTALVIFNAHQPAYAESLPEALTYIPTISDQTRAIVAGVSATVAAATFWLIHQNTYDKNCHRKAKKDKGALAELGRIAFSPYKAALEYLVNIKVNSIAYPAPMSYLNLGLAAIVAYIAAKITFSFTPEGVFINAQDAVKNVLQSETYQELTQEKRDLLHNIDIHLIDANHPHVTARTFFDNIKNSLTKAYNSIAGAFTIQDQKAQSLVPEIKKLALSHKEVAKDAIATITSDYGWPMRWKAYLDEAKHAEIMRLEREKRDLLQRSTRAQEYQAYYKPNNVAGAHPPAAYPTYY